MFHPKYSMDLDLKMINYTLNIIDYSYITLKKLFYNFLNELKVFIIYIWFLKLPGFISNKNLASKSDKFQRKKTKAIFATAALALLLFNYKESNINNE